MSSHRQRPEERIVNYFLNTIEDGVGPVYNELFNKFFYRPGEVNQRAVDPLYDKAGRMFDVYLDEYRNKSEEECLQMVEEDFEGFFWASTADELERRRIIDDRDVNFKEVDDLLRQSDYISKLMKGGGSRHGHHQQQRHGGRGSSRGGYQHQTHVSAYGSSGGNHTSNRSGTSGGFTYSNETHRPQRGNASAGSAYAQAAPANTHSHRQQDNWEDTRNSRHTVVEEKPQRPTRSLPEEPVKQTVPDKKYITDIDEVKHLKVHPKQGVLYTVDPFTQRLRLSIVDGYVWQEVLNVNEMEIEDHLTVIKPERFATRSKLSSPLVMITDGEDVDIRERSELGLRFQAVMDEWKKSGKLKTKETSWLKLKTEEKNAIAAEATRLMLEEMKAKEEADQAKFMEEMREREKALGLDNRRPLPVEEEEFNERIIMTIENQTEKVTVSDYNEAFSLAVTRATDSAVERGIRLPYESLSLDYATTEVDNVPFLQELFQASHPTNGKVTEVFNQFMKEVKGKVPLELKQMLEHRLTKRTNELLSLFGMNLHIDSFEEDFRPLMQEIDRLQQLGTLPEERVKLFLKYLHDAACVHIRPKMELLKAAFPKLNEEQLEVQKGRSFYRYESGTFIYIQLTTSELSISPKDCFVSVGNSRVKALLDGVEEQGRKIILATKDRIFFEVYRDNTRQGYVFRVLDM